MTAQPEITRARTLSEWWLEGSETSGEVLSSDSCALIVDLTTAPRQRRRVVTQADVTDSNELKSFASKRSSKSRKRRSAASQRASRRIGAVASEVEELSWEEAAQMMALEVLGLADSKAETRSQRSSQR